MASPFCWSCLSRLRSSTAVRALAPPLSSTAPSTAAAFHASSVYYANPTKKSNSMEGAPKYRQAKSARMKKKVRVDRPRPPPVGERRALRKRIVLSNPNALEVPGMRDISPETMVDENLRGSVVGIPVPMLDQLRAVQAFKPKQGWSIFRRPGTVMRNHTLRMGRAFDAISGDGDQKGGVVKQIVTGARGTGKSVHLLQAMTMAFAKQWVVFTVPEAQDLVIGHTSYAPIDNTDPPQYVQNGATAALLSRTVTANDAVLSKLHISQDHPALKSLVKPKMSLKELAALGIQDHAIAWTVFQALWKELTATAPAAGSNQDFKPRPPILVTVDNLAHWMKYSEYRSADFKPIHAHDLVFVKHFLSLLKPGNEKPSLPNGGALLYATSESNRPSLYSLDVALDQLKASTYGAEPSSSEFPQPDPYAKTDLRVIDAFASQKPSSAKEGKLRLQILRGVTHREARGYMEYFAQSGLLRENINDEWVGEKWTLSSSGVIGELEKLGKRVRVVA